MRLPEPTRHLRHGFLSYAIDTRFPAYAVYTIANIDQRIQMDG
jgi:hypothetical protein